MNTDETCSGTGPLKVWVKSSFQDFTFYAVIKNSDLNFRLIQKSVFHQQQRLKNPIPHLSLTSENSTAVVIERYFCSNLLLSDILLQFKDSFLENGFYQSFDDFDSFLVCDGDLCNDMIGRSVVTVISYCILIFCYFIM